MKQRKQSSLSAGKVEPMSRTWWARKTGLFAFLIALVCVVAACADDGKQAQDTNPNPSEPGDTTENVVDPNPSKPKDPVTLIFKDSIVGYTEEEFRVNYTLPVEKKFPHIQTVFVPYDSQRSMADMIAAKEPFDIVVASLNNFYEAIVATDIRYDITPLIKQFNYDLERLDPETVALAKQLANGDIYGLPVNNSGAAITYNKDLFDKFGVDYPEDGMTWDEFIALSERMTRMDGDVQYRGAVVFSNFMILRNPFSLAFIDPDSDKVNVDTDQWRDFFSQFARLYQITGNDPANKLSGMQAVEDFTKSQLVAMYSLLSGSDIESYAVDAGMNVDFVQFPTFKERPGVGPQPYPLYFYLSSTSQVKEEAFEVLAYFTSHEYQLESSRKGNFTVLQDKEIQESLAAALPKFNGKNVMAFMPNQFAPPAHRTRYDSIVRGFLETAFRDVVNGEVDINTALRVAQEAANSRVEEIKAME